MGSRLDSDGGDGEGDGGDDSGDGVGGDSDGDGGDSDDDTGDSDGDGGDSDGVDGAVMVIWLVEYFRQPVDAKPGEESDGPAGRTGQAEDKII